MLIIGCGDVGRRVAHRYLAKGRTVTGIVRSGESAELLEQEGIRAMTMDLDLDPLPPMPTRDEQLFYFAPPPARGSEDFRVERALEAFDRDGVPRRVVYVSTTGVYGDCGGAWVDETRQPQPEADRARRRLDAERRFREWSRSSGTELVILRVAGIYGPDRLPLARIREGLPLVRAEEAPFTNRIHEDDLAQVCEAAMERPVAGEIINVSDGHPGTMAEYFDTIADLAGLPHPPKIPLEGAEAHLSAGMYSYMRESRRLDNRKMLELLGVELRYPSFEQGAPACFGP